MFPHCTQQPKKCKKDFKLSMRSPSNETCVELTFDKLHNFEFKLDTDFNQSIMQDKLFDETTFNKSIF